MKVLLAFEEGFRAYIEAIATAIRTFRSDVEVAVVEDSNLEAEVERFGPQLVITSPPPLPKNPVGEQLISWIESSPDASQPSRFQVGERHWETENPTLNEVLSALDETKRLYRSTSRR
jgi:hypothetical protein